jgi:hypothetical protein
MGQDHNILRFGLHRACRVGPSGTVMERKRPRSHNKSYVCSRYGTHRARSSSPDLAARSCPRRTWLGRARTSRAPATPRRGSASNTMLGRTARGDFQVSYFCAVASMGSINLSYSLMCCPVPAIWRGFSRWDRLNIVDVSGGRIETILEQKDAHILRRFRAHLPHIYRTFIAHIEYAYSPALTGLNRRSLRCPAHISHIYRAARAQFKSISRTCLNSIEEVRRSKPPKPPRGGRLLTTLLPRGN